VSRTYAILIGLFVAAFKSLRVTDYIYNCLLCFQWDFFLYRTHSSCFTYIYIYILCSDRVIILVKQNKNQFPKKAKKKMTQLVASEYSYDVR